MANDNHENENHENENQENEHDEDQPHTERELELEQAVATLTERVRELTAVNQRLYVRLGGEQHDDTRTDAEKTDDRLRKFIASHFNRSTLKEDE